MKHLYDIVAVTGSYENRDGEEKKNYVNVGRVLKGDNGPFIVFKRWFNPAAVESKDGGDSIFLSLFEPKEKDEQRPARRDSEDRPARRARDDERPARRSERVEDMDDDIPF